MTLLRSRVVLLVLSAVLLFNAADALAQGRKRPVRLLSGTYVTGQVLDAASNAVVFDAVVTIQGRSVTAGKNGSFAITGLTAGATTAKVERWGYNTLVQPLTIASGANTVVLKPTSKPVVKLTVTDGTVVVLDRESVQFRGLQPFSGYVTVNGPLTLCENPVTTELNLADLSVIDGPGTVTQLPSCCNAWDVTTLRFTLTDGRSFTAATKDCLYYSLHLGGRNRANGDDFVTNLKNIAKAEFQ